MGKKKRSIFLPLNPKSSRLFAHVKILLTVVLIAYLIGLTIWTVSVFTHYKGKIRETKGHIKYKHHSQFFIISGLYIAATTGYGLWSTLEENLSRCKSFVVLAVIGFIFELFGSRNSNDEEVKQLKWVTLVFEPVLIVLMLFYIRLLIVQTQALIYSPNYRRKMVISPGNSSDEDEDGDQVDIETLTLLPTTSLDGNFQSFQRKNPYPSAFSYS